MPTSGNPKGPGIARVFWPAIKGIFCWPKSDDAPAGWGKPFFDGGGSPIDPPRGTLGGSSPQVLLKKPTVAIDIIPLRGRDYPYPEQSFDWRGLESSPNKGDMPFLHFGGPASRYFPYVVAFSGSEITDTLYQTYFWRKGAQIDGPGPTIRGGCIYDQDGANPYYIVITGDDIQNTAGVTFWKKPVQDPGVSWTTIDTISDVRAIGGVRVSNYKYDVPWHFNANGNKAIHVKAARIDGAGQWNGAVKYLISFDLNSVTVDEQLDDGSDAVSASSRSENRVQQQNHWNPANCSLVACDGPPITNWQSQTLVEDSPYTGTINASSSLGGGETLIAADFEYPNDDLIEFRATYDSTSTQSLSQSTTTSNSRFACGNIFNCNLPTIQNNSINQSTVSTDNRSASGSATKVYSITGGDTHILSSFWYGESHNKTTTSTCTACSPGDSATIDVSESYTISTPRVPGLGNDQWTMAILGADLRFKSMVVAIAEDEYETAFDLPHDQTFPAIISGGGVYYNSGTGMRENLTQSYLSGSPQNDFLSGYINHRPQITFVKWINGSKTTTNSTEIDQRSFNKNIVFPGPIEYNTPVWSVLEELLDNGAFDFKCSFAAPSCGSGNFSTSGSSAPGSLLLGKNAPVQYQIAPSGDLAVDRYGSVFWSFWQDEHSSGNWGAETKNVEFSPFTDYEYQGEDIDAAVQPVGANVRYHNLIST